MTISFLMTVNPHGQSRLPIQHPLTGEFTQGQNISCTLDEGAVSHLQSDAIVYEQTNLDVQLIHIPLQLVGVTDCLHHVTLDPLENKNLNVVNY